MSLDGIGKNTYISIGLAMTIIAGTWIICSAIYSTNSHIDLAVTTITNELKNVSARVETLEKHADQWTQSDMYKWSVHLQQANQKQNPPLQVPEPSHTNQ